MNRRDLLVFWASSASLSVLPASLRGQGRSTAVRFESHGAGPTLMFGSPIGAASSADPERVRATRNDYLKGLTDRYRVILMDYPARDEDATTFTPERVSADMLAVANAAGAERFAWYGFSWGAVVGLQLAARTNRLTALICGGWPPLGAPYAATLTAAETLAAKVPQAQLMVTYYRGLQDWAEQDVVSKLTVPRMTFAGSKDIIVASGQTTPIGPLITEHRNDLERIGWTVKVLDDMGHELVNRPDVVVPLMRDFLDPVLLLPK